MLTSEVEHLHHSDPHPVFHQGHDNPLCKGFEAECSRYSIDQLADRETGDNAVTFSWDHTLFLISLQGYHEVKPWQIEKRKLTDIAPSTESLQSFRDIGNSHLRPNIAPEDKKRILLHWRKLSPAVTICPYLFDALTSSL